MPNELITVREAAKLLGIAKRTVHQRVAYGRLVPTIKYPGKTGPVLFDRSYIEAIAARERAEASALAASSSSSSVSSSSSEGVA